MERQADSDDDEWEEWCPYCRENHTGQNMDALQDRIENICNPNGAAL